MIGLAVYFSCGATACYLLGRTMKRKADYLNSITRVIELQWLDDLLRETTNLLVVVSGRVGSAAPFNCRQNGLLGVLLEEKAKLDCNVELGDGSLMKKSLNFLLQEKEAPWYLEDSTGQVNVVGAQYAVGFDDTLKKYVFDMPTTELFNRLAKPEGFKVVGQSCHGRVLNIGTFLTFVGEAVRDKAGKLMIQRPKEQSFLVFSGEGSFDKMVDDMKSNAEVYMLFSKIFGTIAVALAFMYGVDFVRRVLLPFEWEKQDLRNKSEIAKSDSADTRQGEEVEETDTSRF